jgi:hypothetical protein
MELTSLFESDIVDYHGATLNYAFFAKDAFRITIAGCNSLWRDFVNPSQVFRR